MKNSTSNKSKFIFNLLLPPFGGIRGGIFLAFPLWGLGGLFLLGPGAFAQSDWQWGLRGGSTTTHQNGGSFDETIVDMATDREGNLYIVSNVGGQNLDVDGQTYTFHHASESFIGGPADYDMAGLIASFDCNGNYRWGKLISGTYDIVYEIETDSLGHVYVTGRVLPGSIDIFGDLYETHFGNDTIIPYSPNPKKYKKMHFLARYDTQGNFEQLIMPGADSITVPEQSIQIYRPLDLVADPDGTQHWFWSLREEDAGGNPHTPSFEGDTLAQGFYLFRYDHQGNYLGEVKLQMHTVDAQNSLGTIWINHDPVSGSYYLSGYNSIYSLAQQGLNYSLHIGGQLVDSPMFVAKFDSLGQSEWVIKGGNDISLNNQFHGKSQIDNQGNIYLSGTMHGDPVVTFNGYSAQNNSSTVPRSFPVLIKMDPQGILLWGTAGDCTVGPPIACYGVVNGNNVNYLGSYVDITWGNNTFPFVNNKGWDVYVARFNTSNGSFIAMDSIGSDFGYSEYPTAIAAGPRGNVYVGGEFQSKMYVGNDVLQNINVPPSGTDFFVAKFGQANCNCVLPEAKFTFSGNGNGTVNFTFTGSTGYNELEWGFGNGQTTTTSTGSTSHAYANDEEYWVCVTAYNNCGYDTWCTMVEPFHLSLPPLSKSNFQVYPNPVQDQLNIGATEQLSYRLFSINGKELLSGKVEKGRNRFSVGNLPSGFYMLVLENGQGRKRTVKLVKE